MTAAIAPTPWPVARTVRERFLSLAMAAFAMHVGMASAEFQRAGPVVDFRLTEQVAAWVGWWGLHVVLLCAALTALDRAHWPRPAWFAVGVLAVAAATVVAAELVLLTPIADFAVRIGAAASARTLGWYLAWSGAVQGLLLLAILDQWRSRERAEARLDAIRARARVARRARAQARLKLIQARVDPRLLFDMLDAVKRFYVNDPPRAERVLDALIDFLRAALPRLRSARSTVEVEFDLVGCYVALMRQALDRAIGFSVTRPEALRSASFPAGVLLPLAMRLAAQDGGALRLALDAGVEGERLCVRVSASSVPDAHTREHLRDALTDLYDDRAAMRIETTVGAAPVTRVEIAVPLEEANEPSSK